MMKRKRIGTMVVFYLDTRVYAILKRIKKASGVPMNHQVEDALKAKWGETPNASG